MPIIVGLIIYLFFRNHIYNYEQWLNLISIKKYLLHITEGLVIPNFIKFNLPDGLWFYSFLSFLCILWKFVGYKKDFYIIFICCFFTPFIIEILQLFKFISGTFDMKDILTFFISGSLVIILQLKSINFNFKKA